MATQIPPPRARRDGGIELLQQGCDGLVDLIHRGELLMAQAHQNPALHHLHGGFDLALVLRVIRACRQDGGAVVPGKVQHGLVGAGFVAVGVGNQGPGVVGHDELGHATEEAQGQGRGTQPFGHGLARCGAGIGVARGSQGGDEDMGATAVNQLQRGPGVVDEQLLPGAVDLAHGALEALGIAPVVLAELGVAMGGLAGVLGAVLLPQQHQRHALAAQLLVDAAVVGLHKAAGSLGCAQQAVMQGGVIKGLDLWPIQAGGTGQGEVLGDDAFGNIQGSAGLLVGEPGFKFETQNVPYLAHIDPSGIGHAHSSKAAEASPFGLGKYAQHHTLQNPIPAS